MIRKIEIERFSLIASKPFDGVVAAINAGIGHPDMALFWSARKKHDLPSCKAPSRKRWEKQG